MPPRKRNKRRERKAKKAEKEREAEARELKAIGLAVVHAIWSSQASGMDCAENEDGTPDGTRSMVQKISCDHGCGCNLTQGDLVDHPVSTFLDDLFFSFSIDKTSFIGATLMEGFKRHNEVWNNEEYRKSAVDTLISIGTNQLLLKREEEVDIKQVLMIAQSIRVLENYSGVRGLESVTSIIALPRNDLEISGSSNMRDALKFYRKRTSCKCLKRLHLEARKSTPKMGICCNCDKEMERVCLSTCSKCMVSEYCSRDCQVADWLDHKRYCDTLAVQKNKWPRAMPPPNA